MERFAQEYLKGKYEAVYAVHNDKKHMHGHIVFNSVSFETGIKHECKRGEWKHRMQPITNRLCREHGLSIVPEEYVKNPKNLSRTEWEREMKFRDMILEDARFCQQYSGSFEHFMFLMKRIGYQFEYGKYLSVKVPGGKWYHELAKLNECFEEEKFHLYIDMPWGTPKFMVSESLLKHYAAKTPFQMKFYGRIYQVRMIEQRRFEKKSAYLAAEIDRFRKLQEQYLFIVRNDIKTLEGLVTYKVLGERDVERISERQQELYQQNRAKKRKCKTVEDTRDYQIWHMGVQEELDELKAEKKAISQKLKIVDGCLEEYQKFSLLDYSKIEDEIRSRVEVPENPYEVEKAKPEIIYEPEKPELLEESSVDRHDLPEEVSIVAEEEPEPEEIVLPVEDYRAGTTIDDSEPESVVSAEVVDDAIIEEKASFVEEKPSKKKQLSYEEYKKLTPLEKAENVKFGQVKNRHAIQRITEMLFDERGYSVTAGELMDEAEQLYKGVCELFAKRKAQEVFEETERRGLPWRFWLESEKAEVLDFQLDNSAYNIRLYNEVCKLCGVDTSDKDKVFEDYQAIYDRTVDMKTEPVYERRDGGRGRAR